MGETPTPPCRKPEDEVAVDEQAATAVRDVIAAQDHPPRAESWPEPSRVTRKDRVTIYPHVEVVPIPSDASNGKRKTISGLSGQDQDRMLVALMTAAHEYDCDALEAKLSEATKHGIDEKHLEESARLFGNMQSEKFLHSALHEAMCKVRSDGETGHNLTALRNLLKQARRVGVADDGADGKDANSSVLCDAEMVLQQGTRRRARTTIRGSIFDQANADELKILHSTFGSLSTFTGLKSPHMWRGHRASRGFGSGARGAEVMLSHSPNEIKEALTAVPIRLETRALQTFRDILGWMLDRPVPDVQRKGLAQDIIDTAKAEPDIADEIYVQVMKQLTQNPSARSTRAGWDLLLMLTQTVDPSPILEEFTRAFFTMAIYEKREDGLENVPMIARQCVADMNLSIAEKKSETLTELIPIQVFLIDNSARKVMVSETATLGDVAEKLVEQLKIHNVEDFGLFQQTDGLETHRMLPSKTSLAALSEKWMKVMQVTGKTSRLLYKRRFLRVDESLDPGDLVHANLTYKQVMWDYLRYPTWEEPRLFCEIAATIICSEPDHFNKYLQNNRLHEAGVLEQVLPEKAVLDQPRLKWAKRLAEACQAIRPMINPGEPPLMKNNRIMKLIQRLAFFGAHTWLAKETFAVPVEKASVPEAPVDSCVINEVTPEAEYLIAVDLFGVRFVSLECTTGPGFQRGFLFNDQALERLLKWGARQNILQLVVKSLKQSSPTAARVPMNIYMTSAAAIDMAYVIHVICTAKQDRRR